MKRVILGVCLLAAGTLPWAGCNSGSDSSSTATLPTVPTATTVVATFSGTLNQNGAVNYPFIGQAGTVTVTLTALGDTSVPVGVSLGTWSGSTCTTAVANDSATVGSAVTGSITTSTNLCARVYDVGHVTTPQTFTITIGQS